MIRRPVLRAIGHAVRLALFLLATVATVRFFLRTLETRGWSPGALFGLLLVLGTVSLVWRGAVGLRKAIHRVRTS